MKLEPPLLRAARAAAGLSQPALAKAAGVNVRAVAAWERGEYRPREEHARAVVEALEAAGVEFTGGGVRLRSEANSS